MTPGACPEFASIDRPEPDALRRPDVGLRVIRGASVRVAGYGLGMVLTAAASVLLLRYLGVADFGRYMTVSALVAMVSGLTDAGLTTVGSRNLALRTRGSERQMLLSNLLGLRLVITPLGVAAATVFAIVAGYERVLVVGTVLAGAGSALAVYQATMALPLSTDLRNSRLTATDVVKQATMLAALAVLVAAGVGLLPFFGVAIVVAVVGVVVTARFVGSEFVWRPSLDRTAWRALISEAVPLTVSVAMGVFYFQLQIIIMSLVASAVATGLFATSFRVIQTLYAVGSMTALTALPVLAVAAADRVRLGYILQRMTEGAVIGACYLALLVAILAEPVLNLLGGEQYRTAAPILQIQVIALIAVFVAYVWQLTLIALRRQKAMVISNGLALVVALAAGLVLIPVYGAKGAAVAAVTAEVACTLCLLVILSRAHETSLPDFRFLWKPAAAAALGIGVAFPTGLPAGAAAVAATVTYVGVLAVTRAIPSEVVDAFLNYRRRSVRHPLPPRWRRRGTANRSVNHAARRDDV